MKFVRYIRRKRDQNHKQCIWVNKDTSFKKRFDAADLVEVGDSWAEYEKNPCTIKGGGDKENEEGEQKEKQENRRYSSLLAVVIHCCEAGSLYFDWKIDGI
jgi:hypothetical protein